MDIAKTARRRYFHLNQSARECGAFDRREVRSSSDSWEPDWSVEHKSTRGQIEFSNYLNERLPPSAIAVLNTPKPLHLREFSRKLQLFRIESANLHPSPCPSRRERKIEYIAALEVGYNPRKAVCGRSHAHVLLYNLGSIRLEDLASTWRQLNDIKDVAEPQIQPYTLGPEGILYCLKSLGSDADSVIISPKLRLKMAPKP
jgi:hypothetical protein